MSAEQLELPLERGSVRASGRWRIDEEHYLLRVDGRPLKLTLSQFRFIVALINANGKPVPYRKLYDAASGHPGFVLGRDGLGHHTACRTQAKRLRAIFRAICIDDPIENWPSIGYAWKPDWTEGSR